jgi:uncharacterized protein YcbK (DUF882 family)
MQYSKGIPVQLSTNFNTIDFDCKCAYLECKTTLVEPELVNALEELLDIVGDFNINSGFRCERHNKDVRGEKNSKHLLGIAVDIESSKGIPGPEMAKYALQVESFERGGLGVAAHWIHVDTRKVRGRWTYPILNS